MDRNPTNQSPTAFKIARGAEFSRQPRVNDENHVTKTPASGAPKQAERAEKISRFPNARPKRGQQAETPCHLSAKRQAAEQVHPPATHARTLWCIHREPRH